MIMSQTSPVSSPKPSHPITPPFGIGNHASVELPDVQAAASRLQGVAKVTPVQRFRLLSEMVGQPVWLKCENLQRAGSFKIRGAYNRMARLSDEQKARGVVAASAGNHAQGVALAAQILGIDAVIYMPVEAPLPKVEATRGYGAEIRLAGNSVDEALTYARAEAEQSGRTLIHPFDHPDVVAGQGTLALEILQQVPDVKTVVVPVGGGGLIAGIATVLAQQAPQVRVIGVQAENAAAYPDSLVAQKPIPRPPGDTMADGIAVGTPGIVPLEIISRLGVEIRTVTEGQIARALLALLERSKQVVEPSGAAGVAALMAHPLDFTGPIVAILSGGNIDPLLLMRVIRRGLVAGGRYLQLRVELDDRPGALASLIAAVAQNGANVVDVRHSRMESRLGVYGVVITLELETKGHEHSEQVVAGLRKAGFEILGVQ